MSIGTHFSAAGGGRGFPAVAARLPDFSGAPVLLLMTPPDIVLTPPLRSASHHSTQTPWKIGKGTGSFGKRHNKSHTILPQVRSPLVPHPEGRVRRVRLPFRPQAQLHWSTKAIGRRTTGTGRMRYLKTLPRRFKNGFREGTEAVSKKRAASE